MKKLNNLYLKKYLKRSKSSKFLFGFDLSKSFWDFKDIYDPIEIVQGRKNKMPRISNLLILQDELSSFDTFWLNSTFNLLFKNKEKYWYAFLKKLNINILNFISKKYLRVSTGSMLVLKKGLKFNSNFLIRTNLNFFFWKLTNIFFNKKNINLNLIMTKKKYLKKNKMINNFIWFKLVFGWNSFVFNYFKLQNYLYWYKEVYIYIYKKNIGIKHKKNKLNLFIKKVKNVNTRKIRNKFEFFMHIFFILTDYNIIKSLNITNLKKKNKSINRNKNFLSFYSKKSIYLNLENNRIKLNLEDQNITLKKRKLWNRLVSKYKYRFIRYLYLKRVGLFLLKIKLLLLYSLCKNWDIKYNKLFLGSINNYIYIVQGKYNYNNFIIKKKNYKVIKNIKYNSNLKNYIIVYYKNILQKFLYLLYYNYNFSSKKDTLSMFSNFYFIKKIENILLFKFFKELQLSVRFSKSNIFFNISSYFLPNYHCSGGYAFKYGSTLNKKKTNYRKSKFKKNIGALKKKRKDFKKKSYFAIRKMLNILFKYLFKYKQKFFYITFYSIPRNFVSRLIIKMWRSRKKQRIFLTERIFKPLLAHNGMRRKKTRRI